MGTQRSRFAGGDQTYLKHDQYRDTSRLAARTNLHAKYGTATVPWFDWVHATAGVEAGALVLEVGCGEGRLWEAAPASVSGTPITLVDLSAGMVAAALDRIGMVDAGPDAVGVVADVERLPFRGRSFDVVIANHMLYHASDPASAVAELARLMRADGLLVAATNGPQHLAELGEIRAEVFGIRPLDDTLAVFGIETGRVLLDSKFTDVDWVAYDDQLVCTDPDDVLAYLRSVPPGEGATADQDAQMEMAVTARFEEGGGSMIISKDSGLFLCRRPHHS